METKERIDENATQNVSTKYPTWKKVAWAVGGAAVVVGVGAIANKFGWLPKGKVVEKVIERSRPIVQNAAKQVANGAAKAAGSISNVNK